MGRMQVLAAALGTTTVGSTSSRSRAG